MVNIAVLASGGGTNLQALIDANGCIPNGRLALVIASKKDAFALQRAEAAGIKTVVIAKKDYPAREDFTAAIINELRLHDIGLIVLAGFLYILSPVFTDTYQNRVINVHPALIPAFSGDGFYGLKVHEAALERGVKLTGATVHFVNDICDGGPIILQRAVRVLDGDTPETLQQRVMREAEHIILPEAVSLFCDNRLTVAGNKVYINEVT